MNVFYYMHIPCQLAWNLHTLYLVPAKVFNGKSIGSSKACFSVLEISTYLVYLPEAQIYALASTQT